MDQKPKNPETQGTNSQPQSKLEIQSQSGAGIPNSSTSLPFSIPPELQNHPQYEVIKQIGRGGMGVLYLVEHRVTARKEALKIIHPHLLNKANVRERFLREIQTAARLNHPNVVQTLSAIAEGNLLGLIMEYAPGETLQKLVVRIGQLSVDRALDFIAQAAEGLHHAHELGMVHRDIKPANLMITRNSDRLRLRILDFGLAKSNLESDEQRQMTQADNILGTPEYISPEQALKPSGADIRADIYSLGCCFYFSLTGQVPFQGETTLAVLHAHLIGDYKPIQELRPDIPKCVESLLEAMMAKDVAKRIQTPEELIVEIKKCTRLLSQNASSKPVTKKESTVTTSPAPSPAAKPIVATAAAPVQSSPMPSDEVTNEPVQDVSNELFEALANKKNVAPNRPSPKKNHLENASASKTNDLVLKKSKNDFTVAGLNLSNPMVLSAVCLIPLAICLSYFLWSFYSNPKQYEFATLSIAEIKPDTTIFINGKQAEFKKDANALFVTKVKPGTIVVSFRRDGQEYKKQQMKLANNQQITLQTFAFRLPEEQTPAASTESPELNAPPPDNSQVAPIAP